MRKKIVSILGGALLTTMVMLNATTMAFASSGSGTVKVNDNAVMTQAVVGATRSGNYSYVSIKARSVYPTGDYSEDNYIILDVKQDCITIK